MDGDRVITTDPAGGRMDSSAFPHRRSWVAAGLAVLGVLLVFLPTVTDMAKTWLRSETFTHGVIVFPVVMWLLWRDRSDLAREPVSPSYLSLGVFVALCGAWLVAAVANIQVASQLAVVLMIPAVTGAILGPAVLRRAWFPFAWLLFAVPAGEGLVPVLMEMTADFTVAALRLIGIPVYREGLYFSIPSGDFEVAKACSGIRYLIASLSVGSLYAWLTYHSWRRRLTFIVLSAVIPLVANGLRALGIVLIAHYSQMRYAVGLDHLIYGWVFFGAIMLLMFWIGARFQDDPPTGKHAGSSLHPRAPSTGLVVSLAAFLIAFSIVPRWQHARLLAAEEKATPVPLLASDPPAGWTAVAGGEADWRPFFTGAREAGWNRFSSGDDVVDVHILSYYRQVQGAELVNDMNRMYDGDTWQRRDDRRVGVPSGAVRETVISGSPGERIVWHWYQVGDRTTVSGVRVKLWEALALLRGDFRGARMVAVSTPVTSERNAARDRLAAFVGDYKTPLMACLADGSGLCLAVTPLPELASLGEADDGPL